MKRRIGHLGITGLGVSSRDRLDNTPSENEKINKHAKIMFAEALSYFPLMKRYQCLDFKINPNSIEFGIEPTYKFDPLEYISLHLKDKNKSFKETGRAIEVYASRTISKRKQYSEYQRSCKFVKFIDRWFDIFKSLK